MMLLKELVLTSLESFGDFEVNGKILTNEEYLKLADKEVENYYLDVNKENNQAFMVVKLEDEQLIKKDIKKETEKLINNIKGR